MKAPVPMHIPDGFLSVAVSGILWVVSLVFIFIALKKAGKEIDESRLPLVGVLAAAIFAGQMLNFAVAGGTSGHLLGAALAVLLVGPWPAVLVMTSVVTVQALVFQDGGVLTLGANLFNMAVVGVVVAYFVSNLFKRWFGDKRWATLLTAFAAGWFSIFIAALAASLELALSGTSPANIAIPGHGRHSCFNRHRRRPDHLGRGQPDHELQTAAAGKEITGKGGFFLCMDFRSGTDGRPADHFPACFLQAGWSGMGGGEVGFPDHGPGRQLPHHS